MRLTHSFCAGVRRTRDDAPGGSAAVFDTVVSPPFPSFPPDTVIQKLDRTPGTVMLNWKTIWLVHFPFRSFGEAVLYGAWRYRRSDSTECCKTFDVFDSVIDRRYEPVLLSPFFLNNCAITDLIRVTPGNLQFLRAVLLHIYGMFRLFLYTVGGCYLFPLYDNPDFLEQLDAGCTARARAMSSIRSVLRVTARESSTRPRKVAASIPQVTVSSALPCRTYVLCGVRASRKELFTVPSVGVAHL